MADGRGRVVRRRDDVLTVLTCEEAQRRAVEEGMRPVPLQTRSMLTSETSLSHRGPLLIHFAVDSTR